MEEGVISREGIRLTSVDRLGSVLGNRAGVVDLGRLVVDSSSRAVMVEVASVVHGPLEGVVLPAENVVTVGSGATLIQWLESWEKGGGGEDGPGTTKGRGKETKDSPEVHGVDEGVGAVSGPEALVGEFGDVPHDLEHELGQGDGVGRGAAAAEAHETAGGVGDVALVVNAVEVPSVPAAERVFFKKRC